VSLLINQHLNQAYVRRVNQQINPLRFQRIYHLFNLAFNRPSNHRNGLPITRRFNRQFLQLFNHVRNLHTSLVRSQQGSQLANQPCSRLAIQPVPLPNLPRFLQSQLQHRQ
jgi:hypothetical protein